MIRSTTRPTFATCLWDSATGTYPARPDAELVRWVGPVQPVRSVYVAGDEWRSYNVARSPLQVGGCVLWLDPDDLAAVDGYSDTDPVTTWTAKVGPSPSTGVAPTYTASGGPNSGPAVDFDGADYLVWAVNEFGGYQWYDSTFIIVGRPDDTAARCALATDVTGFNGDIQIGVNTQGSVTTHQTTPGTMGWALQRLGGGTSTGAVIAEDDGPVSTANPRAWGMRMSTLSTGTDTMDFWDGTTQVQATGLNVANINGPIASYDQAWNLGRNPLGSEYWDGIIAEVIVFDRCISTAEMESLMLWLNDKHGEVLF